MRAFATHLTATPTLSHPTHQRAGSCDQVHQCQGVQIWPGEWVRACSGQQYLTLPLPPVYPLPLPLPLLPSIQMQACILAAVDKGLTKSLEVTVRSGFQGNISISIPSARLTAVPSTVLLCKWVWVSVHLCHLCRSL